MRHLMGTNYYWLPPHPLVAPVHIGKSSAGWCFALHVYPQRINDEGDEGGNEYPAKDLEEWKQLFEVKNSFIRDEYGEMRTPEKMINIIIARAWTSRIGTASPEWYKENHAIEGPFGLIRHALGDFCQAHGEGTWDMCVGDFS